MSQMNLFSKKEPKDFLEEQRELIERDTITDIDFGPWGVRWRGANIPIPDSSFQDDHTAQFGFSCAGCGASAVNQEKLIHENNCDSKSPYHKEEEVEYE